MSLRRLFSLPLLPSIIFVFLPHSVSHCLVPTCSLKSCSPPVVFRQSKDKVEICWLQWTVHQCVLCVCAHALVHESEVDIESLMLLSPRPDRWDPRPSPFNLLMLDHMLTQTKHTFEAAVDKHNNTVRGLLLSRSCPCV